MPDFDFKLKVKLNRTHPENEVGEFVLNALRNQASRYAVASAFFHAEVELDGHAVSAKGKLGAAAEMALDVDSDKLKAAEEAAAASEETREERAIRVTKEAAAVQEEEDKKLKVIEEQEEGRQKLKEEIAPKGPNPVEIAGQPVDQAENGSPIATAPLSEGDKQPDSLEHKDKVEGTNNPTDGRVTDPSTSERGSTAPTPESNPGQEAIPEPTEPGVATQESQDAKVGEGAAGQSDLEDVLDGKIDNPEPTPPPAPKSGFKKK